MQRAFMATSAKVLLAVLWSVGADMAGEQPATAPAAVGESFEQGLGVFTVASWRSDEPGRITAALARSGRQCVELVGGAGPTDITVLWWHKPAIRLLPGEQYVLSAWVKTQDVAGVELRVAVPEGARIDVRPTPRITGTADWTRLEQRFTVSAPVQPLYLAVWMTGPGRAWVDDLSLSGRTGAEWRRTVEIEPAGAGTEQAVVNLLKQNGMEVGPFVNWYTGRFPSISFIGGHCNGNVSEDLEFFYEKPFRYYNQVADFVMERGGRVYGIRARVRRYKEAGAVKPMRSFLLTVRCDNLLRDYHPSYIIVNGRRVWDSRRHPVQQGRIVVPFALEEPVDPVIDFVVDEAHTPAVKGLAFRMFFVNYLGEPGVRVELKGAEDCKSPADALKRFAFGLFPADWDFWGDRGLSFAEIRRAWKPNVRPDYPVDDLWLSPFVFEGAGHGRYHQFMTTWGGCNILGSAPDLAAYRGNAYIRGAMASMKDAAATKAVLDAGLEAHWFGGEYGVLAPGSEAAHSASMDRQRAALEQAKKTTGRPEKVVSIYEPFSPALTCAHEYERGHDVVVLKNEEDPQYNIMMSMARGAGRTFGKPFGFYWEQTHYPDPSQDFKLHACLLYYLCGGSWIGAEAENYPAFEREIVAERAIPFVQALRFAMVHPARGAPVVPVGIVWTLGDRWIVPYNPLGHLDTFLRCFDYDHALGRIVTWPNFLEPQPWTPPSRNQWNFNTTGHMAYLYDAVPEIKGYDLLDVFFPQYGDACTARIARLLTGTPYGPLDFVYGNRASAEHLRSFGLLAMLGRGTVRGEMEGKLLAAAEAGCAVVLGAQHFRIFQQNYARAMGLEIVPSAAAKIEGALSGEFHRDGGAVFSGTVLGHKGAGWQTVADVAGRPVVVRRTVGKGAVYVFLGQWMHEGGTALRPVLAALAARCAPLRFEPADDQIEYVCWRKGAGAWAAVFNHGAIVVGSDRIREFRAKPPEPLASAVKGPWRGEIAFRLERLGLDAGGKYALYEVEGIDEPAFGGVIAGTRRFAVKQIASRQADGIVTAAVQIGKRAQYVLAPPGEGEAVFFGKP